MLIRASLSEINAFPFFRSAEAVDALVSLKGGREPGASQQSMLCCWEGRGGQQRLEIFPVRMSHRGIPCTR